MKMTKTTIKYCYACLLITLVIFTLLTGCGRSTLPPADTSSTIAAATETTPGAATIVIPDVTLTPALSPVSTPVPSTVNPVQGVENTPALSTTPTATYKSLTPTKTPAAEVVITSNKTVLSFPESITFLMECSSLLPVESLTLEYDTNGNSSAKTVNRVQLEISPGTIINASYTWEMKKTGSIPPKAEVTYRWKVKDNASRIYYSPWQTMVFEDTRFQWQSQITNDMEVFYHNQTPGLIQKLVEDVQSSLSRIQLNVVVPENRKIIVLLYNSSEEVRSSGLFNQDWMGGKAYPGYNTIVMSINEQSLDWAKGALPHEITHLLVEEAVYGPFGSIPQWLHEGLAGYAEGSLEQEYQEMLVQALKSDSLLSIKSLSSSFPADSNQANLAYKESHSIVTYLVDTYGWEKIRQLLATFKDGSTYDKALNRVYGFDTAGLDAKWRVYLGK
jgi:hypothetical protein